jgi:hypothetical protein
MVPGITEMALTGGASAALGAGLSLVGKMATMANEQKKLAFARDAEELRLITESMNTAQKRGGAAGEWVRRFMVIALFAFMFCILPINGIIQHFVENGVASTFVFISEEASRWFGLIGPKTEVHAIPVTGIPIFRTFVEMGWLMASFYFGSSRIK